MSYDYEREEIRDARRLGELEPHPRGCLCRECAADEADR